MKDMSHEIRAPTKALYEGPEDFLTAGIRLE
jgi:hypothetical protein